MWEASDWRDVSTYRVTSRGDAGGTVSGEDPFLYVQNHTFGENGTRVEVLHALSHAGGWDSSGGHAWSVDGGRTWQNFNDRVRAYGSLFLAQDN